MFTTAPGRGFNSFASERGLSAPLAACYNIFHPLDATRQTATNRSE